MVACGGHHTVAVSSEGEVYSWGWGNEGQLGNGSQYDQLTPTIVRGLDSQRICSAACGYYHTVVSTETGAVFCWGKGSAGQLGFGDPASSLVPRPIAALSQHRVHQVACGAAHTLAVANGGEVFAWGQGGDGQLGVGPPCADSAADAHEPRRVVGLDGVAIALVACGSRHSLAAAADGRLFTWGLGDDGRLGHGDAEPRHSPAHVCAGGALERARVRGIAGGGHHSAAVTEAGQILTCGRGTYGQLGHGRAASTDTFTQARRPPACPRPLPPN